MYSFSHLVADDVAWLEDLLNARTGANAISDLRVKSIDRACFLFLTDRLPKKLAILELNLSDKNVEQEDLLRIANCLPSSLLELKLVLGYNKLDPEACLALSKGLPSELSRLELGLSETKVGPTGCAALANALPRRLTTLKLDLSSAEIDDTGVESLAASIPADLLCLELNLSLNTVTDRGVTALANALPNGLVDCTLKLWSNPGVGGAGALALSKALARVTNESARLPELVLELDYDKVNDDDMRAINKALASQQRPPPTYNVAFHSILRIQTGRAADGTSASPPAALLDSLDLGGSTPHSRQQSQDQLASSAAKKSYGCVIC